MNTTTETSQPDRRLRRDLIVGLVAFIVLVAIVIIVFAPLRSPASQGDPWSGVPEKLGHTDHTALMPGPYVTGQAVTRACLECHPEAGEQMLHSEHFTWLNDPVQVAGRDEPVALGKSNAINNFCLGVQGNWDKCTICHAGYGWDDESFDFNNSENIDCLVCHAQEGYAKGLSGNPAEGSDLVAAAGSVALPSRWNCGQCHFDGGGGNGVKHGDLDDTLIYPDENLDVHMGRHDLVCTDCHQTQDHQISGTAISVALDDTNMIACADCHDQAPHLDDRLNAHAATVACETCHIPSFALKDPTKMWWDWSSAGDDTREENHLTYLKIKGNFVYRTEVEPEYYWFDGTATRYLMGDTFDPADAPIPLNYPNGDIADLGSKIWPFKVHRAKQPYDPVYDYILKPKLTGEGGFWVDFDWDRAFRLATPYTGLDYSGQYDFIRTDMWWPVAHMVQPAEKALQCNDCHGDGDRMDWTALGYPGDPMFEGGRSTLGLAGGS